MKNTFIINTQTVVRFGIILIFIFVFAGCGEKETGVTLEFWTLQLSPTFNGYFSDMTKEYENSHPGISIRWVDIPYDAAVQKLLSSVAAGNAPDIINLSADFLAKFSEMGAFTDLSKFIPPERVSRYFPHAVEMCRHNGQLAALPWYLNTYVLIYNKQFFKDAGFTDTDIPKTFSALIEFVKEYKKRTGKYALFWNIGKDSYLPLMLESEGISMTDSAMTKPLFNSEEGTALLSAWIDLVHDGYLEKESVISTGSRVIEAYQSGQVAMVFTGPVFLGRIKANAPEIFRNTGVAANPVGKTGRQELAAMALSVLSTSRFPKESADFLEFVLSAENQLAFSKIAPTYPSIMTALCDSFFAESSGDIISLSREVGAAELPYAVQLNSFKRHPEYFRLKELFDEAIQKASLGKMPSCAAIDDAARQWSIILSENQPRPQ